MEVDMLKVAVQYCGTDDRGEVEEHELSGDDDLRVKVHKRTVEVPNLEDTSAKKHENERVRNPFFEDPD